MTANRAKVVKVTDYVMFHCKITPSYILWDIVRWGGKTDGCPFPSMPFVPTGFYDLQRKSLDEFSHKEPYDRRVGVDVNH